MKKHTAVTPRVSKPGRRLYFHFMFLFRVKNAFVLLVTPHVFDKDISAYIYGPHIYFDSYTSYLRKHANQEVLNAKWVKYRYLHDSRSEISIVIDN